MSGLDWAVEFEEVTSSTRIAVTCKLKSPVQICISGFYHSLSSDPPEQAEINQEDDASRGGSVELTCGLEDAGNPEAEEFVWKK